MSFVYFIREDGEPGYIKIGASDSPVHRLLQLQAGNPRPLKLIVAVEYIRDIVAGTSQRIRRFERKLHERFAELRLNPDSEWFEPAPALLNEIDLYLENSEPLIAPHANGARVVSLPEKT